MTKEVTIVEAQVYYDDKTHEHIQLDVKTTDEDAYIASLREAINKKFNGTKKVTEIYTVVRRDPRQ